MSIATNKKINITKCSACGEDHTQLSVQERTSVKVINGKPFTHMAWCPVKNKEIFIAKGEVK